MIYEIFDDLRRPSPACSRRRTQDSCTGHAEIRQVFKVSKVGNIAGCMVTDGHAPAQQQDTASSATAWSSTEDLSLDSLKRFKDDVKEVNAGLECGIKLAGYDDIKVGDRFEAYKTVDVAGRCNELSVASGQLSARDCYPRNWPLTTDDSCSSEFFSWNCVSAMP